ncbi:MAG: glycosyltransferase family 4 protein [Cyclobacteriaceae bacterium]
MSEFAGKHILIIVENLPAPFDRRVWQEATALDDKGAKVSIICPKMKGYTKSFESIDGIDIYRHYLPFEGSGPLGYLWEYSCSLFFELFLAWKIFIKKRFHVIHGCNPPDLIFLIALFFKPFKVKYIFDHHDINPELYIAKYGKKGFFYNLMVFLEKMTFRFSDYSIATNESYKSIAISRGGMNPNNVQVVRSGPSLNRLKIQSPNSRFKNGKRFLVGYLGVIGDQEGIDLLLRSVQWLRERRDDFCVGIVGGGTSLEKLKNLSVDMGLDDIVTFYGRVSDQVLLDVLNTADVCVNPDVPTEMNNLSTMNKIMEYMALKKPIVQFDLKEGRFSAQKASLYASGASIEDFGGKMEELLDSASLRQEMGEFGYQRVVNELSWEYEKTNLFSIYRKIFND